MAQWVDGRVVERIDWTGRLHSLRIEADIEPFRAGQFTKLGLVIDGEIVGRPYSIVSAPGESALEFYFSTVPEGPLSPRLAALQAGDIVRVAPKPNGFLVLDEVVSVAMTQPDFVKLADAYGIRGLRVETKSEVASAIREARAHKGPILLDFQIDQEENVWPMVPAGAALSETIEAPAEELAR